MQVDLLLLFLSHEKTLQLRATAVRCLHFIFSQGICHVPVNGYVVKTLLSILDEPEIPTSMLCEVLQTLRKVVSQLIQMNLLLLFNLCCLTSSISADDFMYATQSTL